MKKIFKLKYNDIISIENLLQAWKEFLNGKKRRKDVQEFERNLMSNIISLHNDLSMKTYHHSAYEKFNVSDPKPRNIHKARVRDRLLHHAIYRKLYSLFNNTFISDSYSCRLGKGTHKAIKRFEEFGRKVGRNNTRNCWVLKCDIRKFFASIDHEILVQILDDYLADKNIVWLLNKILESFHFRRIGVGLPLGNLTSQMLVNIYMNRFDQFVKHKLKAKYYIRYADDFVFLNQDIDLLLEMLSKVAEFLDENLKLSLHPNKVFISTLSSGVDFLGWINFPKYRVLRTATKRKMFRKIHENNAKARSIQSYLGMLSHGNADILKNKLLSVLVTNNNFSKILSIEKL